MSKCKKGQNKQLETRIDYKPDMLVQNMTVLFNPSEQLAGKLPIGYQIHCSSPLVLVVGENGSGKTGLLRLLNT